MKKLMLFMLFMLGFGAVSMLFAADGDVMPSTGVLLQQTAIAAASMWLTNRLKVWSDSFSKNSTGKRLVPVALSVLGTVVCGISGGAPLAAVGNQILTGAITGIAAQGAYTNGQIATSTVNLASQAVTNTLGHLFEPKKK